MITRNCTQGLFLLRPDPVTANAFIYCLGIAQMRSQVDVMGVVQMSNHLHDNIFDRQGTAPTFYRDFHGLLAKCLNARWGRWENFFASTQTNVVHLQEREDLIRKLVYTFTNPVKDGLVARVADWPGANGYEALITGKPLRATRPRHFFAEASTLPDEIELHLRIPPELGDHDEIVAEVKQRVEAFEVAEAARRAVDGQHVLGRNAVMRQSWRRSPTTGKPRRGLRPTIAAKSLWARLEAIQRKHEFVTAYRHARRAWLAGTPIPFPAGTYWLRRYMGVEVAPQEKMN
jgi:putative transposase